MSVHPQHSIITRNGQNDYRSERNALSRTKPYEHLLFAISFFRSISLVLQPVCHAAISVQKRFHNFENSIGIYVKLRCTWLVDKIMVTSLLVVFYILQNATQRNLKGFMFFYCRKYDFYHYQLM